VIKKISYASFNRKIKQIFNKSIDLYGSSYSTSSIENMLGQHNAIICTYPDEETISIDTEIFEKVKQSLLVEQIRG